VLRLAVAEGDEVEERAVLLVLEAMKMEHPVWAPFAGRVARVACREGDQVAAGDLLLELAAGAATESALDSAGTARADF
jgi:3-methylcrotonyl-CoA carboxylase alpha subunit